MKETMKDSLSNSVDNQKSRQNNKIYFKWTSQEELRKENIS